MQFTKKTLNTVLLGLTLAGSAGAMADECKTPTAPEIADGAKATMEQMLAGQKAVKAFQAANLEFMACLDPMIAKATAAAKGEKASKADFAALKELETRYNAAVSQEEEIANKFNSAIRAYKAANPS